MARDKEGKPRAIHPQGVRGSRRPIKFVETDTLQREVYTKWGVKVTLEDREEDVLEVYDELRTPRPAGASPSSASGSSICSIASSARWSKSRVPRRSRRRIGTGAASSRLREHFGGRNSPANIAHIHDLEVLILAQDLFRRAEEAYTKREEEVGTELVLRIFRHVYLEALDKAWVDHLTDMDHLRDGIGLRGYGQKDPKQEYKKEGYNLFVDMVARVSSDVVTKLFSVSVKQPEEEKLELDDLARHQELMRGASPATRTSPPPTRPRPSPTPPPRARSHRRHGSAPA